MNNLETFMVLFNHFVCDYEGCEEIEITKLSNSIKIRNQYQDTYHNFKWDLIYEKKRGPHACDTSKQVQILLAKLVA